MKIFNIVFITLFLSTILYGCASTNLQAPCNSTGNDCLPKIKINQWNNS